MSRSPGESLTNFSSTLSIKDYFSKCRANIFPASLHPLGTLPPQLTIFFSSFFLSSVPMTVAMAVASSPGFSLVSMPGVVLASSIRTYTAVSLTSYTSGGIGSRPPIVFGEVYSTPSVRASGGNRRVTFLITSTMQFSPRTVPVPVGTRP